MTARRPPRLARCFAALTILLVLTSTSQAQRQPGQPNPQAPTLNPIHPLGGPRGATLDLTLTGTNLAEPVALWTSFNGKATIPTDNNNGKDNAKLRVLLEVPKDAPFGFHAVRLATTRGVSNLRLFCVDDLPQVIEVDTNRNRATPQAVPVPCVVVGRADPEVNDYFKIAVQAGQRVSFEVLGRRLGSAFDPQLTLFDARTGRELPGGYSNDAPGQQTDPRLTYTFKDAGEYLIEIRDVMYRGGGDFFYRLRIGDFPLATTPLPMAAKRGGKVSVSFAGPQVEGVAPVEVAVPADPTADTVWVTPKGPNGLHGWPVALAVSDLDEAVEQEPNDEAAKANRVAVPGAITARFQNKGDTDHFVLGLKKGQRIIVEAHTLELYSPTEVYMVLKDPKGAQLAASNPAQGQRLDYTAAADGDVLLQVEHLHYWGGPTETYRLTVTPYEPGFDLTLQLDRFDVAPGGSVAVPILVARRDYAGPIEVSVAGPPGVTGKVTIAQGQPAQPNQPAGTLTISATMDVPTGPQHVHVIGKATINGKVVTDLASVRPPLSQGLGNLPYPPRTFLHEVALGVTEKPPFALSAKFDLPDVLRGTPASVTITATRAPGFAEEIAVTAGGLPANVAPALKNIPKSQNEVKVQLTPAANAAVGQFPVTFTGKAKHQNKDFAVTSPPAYLVVALPFDLQVSPAPVTLAPDRKALLRITAVRKGGYQGPIAVELRNLPANVTAGKGTIAMGQNETIVELAAAANAAVGDKADINVLGTASAAGNQQNASANFVVSVKK